MKTLRNTDGSDAANQRLLPSPLPPRLLAALIDYLFVCGLFIAGMRVAPGGISESLLAFIVGAFYFSVSQSRLMAGQSIGKSLFAMKVLSFHEGHFGEPLSLPVSFLRYLSSYGILIALAEVPRVLYRVGEAVAASWQLELPMLAAFIWFFSSSIHMLLDPACRGFHDLIADSAVGRREATEGAGVREEHASRVPSALLAGFALAVVPWWLGIQRPEEVEQILRTRYVLENRMNIRVLNAQATSDEILVEALTLDPDPLRAHEGQQHFVRQAREVLTSLHALPNSQPKIRFRFYHDPSLNPLTADGNPLEVVLEPVTIPASP